MKHLTAYLLFLLAASIANAQTTEIDSINTALSAEQTDTSRIKTLIELRNAYIRTKIHDHDEALIDSIIYLSRTHTFDKGLAFGYQKKGLQWQLKGNLDSAFKYTYRAIVLYKKPEKYRQIVSLYNQLAGLYYMKPNSDSALHYLKKTLQTTEINDIDGFDFLPANIGIFYQRLGFFDSSVFYLQKSLKLLDIEKDKNKFPQIYANLANAFFKLELKKDAVKNFKNAYNVSLELGEKGDQRMLAYGYSQLGKAHFIESKYDSAIVSFKKAIEIDELALPARLPSHLNNLAESYLLSNQLDSSLNTWISAYHEISKYQYPKTEAYSLFGKVTLAFQKSGKQDVLEKRLAERHLRIDHLLDEGLKESVREGDQYQIKEYCRILSNYWHEKGEDSKAYTFLERYSNLSDSLFNVQSQKNTAELKERYESEIKDEKIKNQELQIKADASQKNLYLIMASMLTILLVIASYTGVQIRRKNQDLKEDNELKQSILNDGPFLGEKTLILKNKKVLKLAEIIYIQSQGNDVVYFLASGRQISERQTIKKRAETLPARLFCRIHRSVIVNTQHIRELNKSSVLMSNGELLNLTKNHKTNLTNLIENTNGIS